MITTKTRRCPHCKAKDLPPGYRLHPHCVDGWLAVLREKDEAKKRKAQLAKAKVERAHTKARRRELETIPELIRAADKAFAAYTRLRDQQAGFPCISSGKPLDWSGNQVDAGHYRSRGAASHLRYDERNCHAQSKYENRHRAGNAVEYRIRLIDRIGLAEVEALGASNEPHHWTRDELRAIAATYKAKAKELKEKSE